MKSVASLIILIFFCVPLIRAQKKELQAQRITEKVIIDGQLNELFWKRISVTKGFKMLEPDNGLKAPDTHVTEVKVAYDNDAIYFGVVLRDNNPSSILKEFSQRDNIFVEADLFTIAINTFNDGINEYKFYVNSAGTQADSKTLKEGRRKNDFNWSAVWESAVKINRFGWVVEIKIPYSALRFQNTDVQTWGINFLREIKNRNETYSWNFINRLVGEESQYNGVLNGITNVKPPLRLSFFPFISSNIETIQGQTKTKFSGGLDVKYGLSENFTLDATLVPDFSQTGFDPLSLNLGPFEQTFRERRQFFTEGVDLFNKGSLFYSRRIGGRPSGAITLNDDETVIDKPSKVKVLNIFKISGRTKSGIGIGFLNAITKKTEATILNTQTNSKRHEVIEPLANYNVMVVDKQFNNNSSVSFVNTNTLRKGHFRDANVTALIFDLATKTNIFKLSGDLKYSTVKDISSFDGFSSKINIGKTAGNLRYQLKYNMADNNFNVNDLGKQRRNNYSNFSGNISFQKLTPQGAFNRYRFLFFTDINYLYEPNVFTSSEIGLLSFFTTKNQQSFKLMAFLSPTKTYDYFEPRTAGRFFIRNKELTTKVEFETDDGKKISSDFSVKYTKWFNDSQKSISFSTSPQIRLNNKFKINYSFEGRLKKVQPGFVTQTETAIIFGRRDVKEIENSMRLTYNYSTTHAIGLNFRNYWSTVQYGKTFFSLSENGTLANTNQQPDFNADTNFNVWNLDLNYSWQFAPGSQAVLLLVR